MEILPIHTSILRKGDDLVAILRENADIASGDIVVVSSKAVATVEGAAINLGKITASAEAKTLAERSEKPAAYYQVVLDETKRMNGTVIQNVHGIVLTELKPDGMEGSFLVPNAGIDRSNAPEGFVIGWPVDPVQSAKKLSDALNTPVIITDSGLSPRRRGVTSFALTVCGTDPLVSLVDTPDLFGHDMRVTEEAVADQLSTAANFLMGNSNQSIPAVVIRHHGLPSSYFCGWVPGIERGEDLYHGVI